MKESQSTTLIGLLALLGAACSSPDARVVVVPGGASAPTPSAPGAAGAGGASSGGGTTTPPSSDGGAGSTTPSDGGAGAPSGTGGASGSGVPCDVATMLAANCTSCHSDPPLASALAGLVTYADLMAISHEDPTKNEAQLSLARMQSASSPMPPGAPPPAAEITTLQNWINAGYPKGACDAGTSGGSGTDGGTNAGGTDGGAPPPPVSVWNGAPAFASQTGPSTHNAGKDCMNCHGSGGSGPGFAFGGTVYDGSGAAVVGAEVRFVDSTGKATSVYSGPSGTFYLHGTGFSGPAHVGVRDATNTQEMFTALQSGAQSPASSGGACSACHCSGTGCTQAPIHLP
jgi:hypothetical protein